MLTSVDIIRAALVEVLNASARPPALLPLARIKYPGRELQPRLLMDGSYQVVLPLSGWEYKRRAPRPKFLPPVVPAAIQAELNDALPNGLTVTVVEDHGNHISIYIITMEEAT